jgi:hypothetical protein
MEREIGRRGAGKDVRSAVSEATLVREGGQWGEIQQDSQEGTSGWRWRKTR